MVNDCLSVAILILTTVLAFLPDLFLGLKAMDPDLFTQGIPVMAWYGNIARVGGDVLWTTGILGGFPIAFTQYSLFDPIDWTSARILDPDRAYAMVRISYLPLAGVSTYYYARTLGLSRLPSLLAGLGYQLSSEALTSPANGNGMRSLFLLPTLLLSIERVFEGRPRWAALIAFATGVSSLTGGPYITAIALMNAGGYTLARGCQSWRQGIRKPVLSMIALVAAAVVVGVCMAAVRILPGTVVTAASVRAHGMSLAAAATGSPGIVGLVVGYLVPLTRLTELGFTARREFYAPSYVGPVILLLALSALSRVKSSGTVAIIAMLALFNVLASLGDTGPLFGILHALPGMGYFRGPQRFSTASALFLSVLAAYSLHVGIPSFTTSYHGRRWLRALAISSSALAFAAFVAGFLWQYGGPTGAAIREFAEAHRLGPANPLRPRFIITIAAIPATFWLLYGYRTGRTSLSFLKIMSLVMTTAILIMVGLTATPRQQPLTQPPATATFLRQDKSLFRILSYNPSIAANLILAFLSGNDPGRVDSEAPRELNFLYRYHAETLSSNFALQYGLESIEGYELLQSHRQAIALSFIGSVSGEIHDFEQTPGLPGDSSLGEMLWNVRSRHLVEHLPALRAFNIKYVLTNLELWQHHSDQLRLAFTSQIPMLDPASLTNVHVYEVLGVLPRAYLVPASVAVRDEVDALDRILSEQVEPSEAVLLEEPGHPLPDGPSLDPANSTVTVESYNGSKLKLNIQTDGKGYLVVNDAFYPGWRAWVDETEVPILPANGWVRAIPIQASGNHSVIMAYYPPLLREGICISVVALSFCVIVLSASFIRFRSPRQ